MKPAQINLINGIILIGLSLWSYFGSPEPSLTALIPAVFGLIFILLGPAFSKGNKVVAHIVVVLTAILIIALFKPLTAALARDDMAATLRVSAMLLSALIAMVYYIRSFKLARRK